MRLKNKVAIVTGAASGFGEGIAGAAVLLCGGEAAFITGVCLEVDGGCCI